MSRIIDTDTYNLGKARYNNMVSSFNDNPSNKFDNLFSGIDSGEIEPERDSDGFIILKRKNDKTIGKSSMTTSLEQLETKLLSIASDEKQFNNDSDNQVKKPKGKKKRKKDKTQLLENFFNNADEILASEEKNTEDDEENKTVRKNTLDSTYGKRFAPIVAYLQDSIADFDELATNIQEELSTKGTTRGVYRSSQMANLISAKNSKLSAVKELASVARIVSDLEYKKSKDNSSKEEDSDVLVARFGTKLLSGSFDDISIGGGKGKNKDSIKKKKKKKKDFLAMTDEEREENDAKLSIGYDDDDDGKMPKQRDLAKAFAAKIAEKKDDMGFTANERFINMEGKYEIVVVVEDVLDPYNSWKFSAVDKQGKEIPNFRKDYKELLPNKKSARLTIDMVKLKATNKSTNLKYRVFIKD